MIFSYLLALIGGLVLFYFFRHWSNIRYLNQVAGFEISHFSNIGFNNLNTDKNIDHMLQKIVSEGKAIGDWNMMKFGSEIELWVSNSKSKDFGRISAVFQVKLNLL